VAVYSTPFDSAQKFGNTIMHGAHVRRVPVIGKNNV
jgi:hypothetical protein